MGLPDDYSERKALPIATGVFDYFPDALAEVARVSKIGNDQHNPGEPLHWSKDKSNDHPDALLRHLMQRGTVDTDGTRHSAKVAWRALALLQTEIEEEALRDRRREFEAGLADLQEYQRQREEQEDDEPGAAGGTAGAKEVGPVDDPDREGQASLEELGSRDCPVCDVGGIHRVDYEWIGDVVTGAGVAYDDPTLD